MTFSRPDIENLSVDERPELIERLEGSLSPDEVGLTRAQEDELAWRLEDADRNPGDGVIWAESQRRIRERKR